MQACRGLSALHPRRQTLVPIRLFALYTYIRTKFWSTWTKSCGAGTTGPLSDTFRSIETQANWGHRLAVPRGQGKPPCWLGKEREYKERINTERANGSAGMRGAQRVHAKFDLQGCLLDRFWLPNPSKIVPKVNAKIDTEKVIKKRWSVKTCQNGCEQRHTN